MPTPAQAAASDTPHVAPPASLPNASNRAAVPETVLGSGQTMAQTETALLRTLLQALQSSSGGLTQVTSLIRDLEKAGALPATPNDLRREINQTLAIAAPLRNLGSDGEIVKALSASPIPQQPEANVATTALTSAPPPLVTELKGALVSLLQVSQGWTSTASPAVGATAPQSAATLAVTPAQHAPTVSGEGSPTPVPTDAASTPASIASAQRPASPLVAAEVSADVSPTLYPFGLMSAPLVPGSTVPATAKGGMADAMVSLLLSQQALATPPEAMIRTRSARPGAPSPDGPDFPHGSANPALQAYRKAQPATPVQAATPWPQDPGTPFIVRTIAARAEAALNQIRLLETAAQLNRAEQASAGAPAAVEPRWTFDLPLQTPFGDARARFEVARDGVRTRNGAHAVVWRARFSMDLEPLGPVHAQIALMGKHAWVSLWAEREASMSLLEQQQATLRNAFSADSVEAEVICCLGKPPARPAGSGAVWDGEV